LLQAAPCPPSPFASPPAPADPDAPAEPAPEPPAPADPAAPVDPVLESSPQRHTATLTQARAMEKNLFTHVPARFMRAAGRP
jgi:hypothetical protein